MRALVAVDLFGEATDTVVRAVEWAHHMDATLDLVYADTYYERADFIRDAQLREMVFREWDDYRVRFRTQLDMLQLRIPKALRGRTIVREGRPGDVLLELAPDYDVVMVATHGRTGLERLVMGSVAEKFVRLSPVPVLVIHPKDAEAA